MAPDLSALQKDYVFHGFFTREGGVSTGIYKSLNTGLGSDDVREHVLENRRRITSFLGVREKHLVTVHQTHSTDVVTVEAPFADNRTKADAMVTNVTGLALGVLTADCGPVLFADTRARVIGAAHAGWRGALAGILENTVSAMQALGARRKDIVAVLGPCIGPQDYEVGEEFRTVFLADDNANKHYFVHSQKNGHFHFNLWSFITDRLKNIDVKASAVNICTYADESRFFSYRRTTHNHESDYGRQISTIVLGKQ